MKRFLTLLALLMIAPIQALADVTVEGAWVRLPPPVADTAAAYLTLKNSGDADVTVTGVTTAVADAPDFHSMKMENGTMSMQKMDPVVIPAHGELAFTPGGNHLMLTGLKEKLEAGQHVMLTIKTSDGDSIMVHAEVRDMRNKVGHSTHDGHDMHDMHGHGHH